MLFNSLEYIIFLPIVFLLYWYVFNRNVLWRNAFLLFVSYIFYGWWDYRFLFLLMFSTFLDYFTGLKMEKDQKHRKAWFWLSVSINIGFLAIFKYYNFFITSFAQGLESAGIHINVWTLKVILPIGISFYTFHGLSYVIDIYKNKIKPINNFVEYAVFVSFFPLLVAGPIERATHLLPQFKTLKSFEYAKAVDGMRQILWGFFKKIVVADTCARLADNIFSNYQTMPASMLVLGALYFTFQIYGDFSGYSDIALGTARLFGIELMKNFNFPYLSRDIAEFWRRWHISLSSWFRDYLYIPLGGSKGGALMRVRNTFIIFIVSGFWHGANWTFIVWGALNALYIMPSIIFATNRNNLAIVAQETILPTPKEVIQIIFTFLLTMVAWVFFRAESVAQATDYLFRICDKSLISFGQIKLEPIPFILILYVIEYFNRKNNHALEGLNNKSTYLRWLIYIILIVVVFKFYTVSKSFIYFQF
jgi:alginate O-acetyltransferase complex protein AlgI